MEFHEKLQELRKQRGMTQEELAKALYVSRTAVSKWESARGYPSIESLKVISGFFHISIDDLLSADTLISLAEKEKDGKICNICDLLFGMIDICFGLLAVLPLYPSVADGMIYSVSLFEYDEVKKWILFCYWIFFGFMVVMGLAKMFLAKCKVETGRRILMELSLVINGIVVIFLGVTRVPYAILISFLLFVLKGILFLQCAKANK